MRSEEFYDFTSEECLASYFRAKHLCAKLQTMTIEDEDYRKTIEDLIPGIPESSTVSPPFHCDHGHGIKLGAVVVDKYILAQFYAVSVITMEWWRHRG